MSLSQNLALEKSTQLQLNQSRYDFFLIIFNHQSGITIESVLNIISYWFQVAQQEAQRAAFVVERAKQEKQQKIVQAEGEAEAAKMISFSNLLDCTLWHG